MNKVDNMYLVKVFLILPFLAVVASPFVFAEEETVTTTQENTETTTVTPKMNREIEERILREKERTRELLKLELERKKENLQKASELKEEALKKRNELLQENLKKMLEKKKIVSEEIFKEKRDRFKMKVAEIKDVRKKILLTNLDTKIAMINKKRTEEMTKIIKRLREVLAKIESRATGFELSESEKSELETAVNEAKVAIDNAETSVIAQAEKQYIAEITTESELKDSLGAIVKQMEKDLQDVNMIILAAKKSLSNAGKLLNTVIESRKVDTESEKEE